MLYSMTESYEQDQWPRNCVRKAALFANDAHSFEPRAFVAIGETGTSSKRQKNDPGNQDKKILLRYVGTMDMT